jgi:hypothetical protein
MTSSRRTITHILVTLLTLLALTAPPARAEALEGSWTLTGFEGSATFGKSTGLLVFADGHFSLVYAMEENGKRWGRAHAGRYTVQGETLTYHVGWDIQYARAEPAVSVTPADHKTRFTLTGDVLTVTFSNGGVQTFKRMRPGAK